MMKAATSEETGNQFPGCGRDDITHAFAKKKSNKMNRLP
jgi:hypothetical protein